MQRERRKKNTIRVVLVLLFFFFSPKDMGSGMCMCARRIV